MNLVKEYMNNEWRDESDRTGKVITAIVFICGRAPLEHQHSQFCLPWLPSTSPFASLLASFPLALKEQRAHSSSRHQLYGIRKDPEYGVSFIASDRSQIPVFATWSQSLLASWGSHVVSITPALLMAFIAHCEVLRKFWKCLEAP